MVRSSQTDLFTRRRLLKLSAAGLGIAGAAALVPLASADQEFYVAGVERSGRIERVWLSSSYICYAFSDGDTALGELSTTGPEGNSFETDVPASGDEWCIKWLDPRTFSGNTGQYRSVLTSGDRVIGRASYRIVESTADGDENDWWPFW